ncbi:MAG: hypothetical protein QOG80_1982 [Pseudonocardiales bacterium]|nr:hypothetical protein [Pseudonocardiales bacterium]
MECPTCHRPVTDPDASFCAGCGAPLRPPTTVDLDTPPPAPVPEPVRSDETVESIDNRPAAYAALLGAVLGTVGAFQVWLRISVGNVNPPGSAETGWKGGDGRTIVVAALVAAVAGVGLLLRRRDLWLKVALLIAGGVTLVIALVHMADVPSKGNDIEMQFGIPSGDVRAEVGAGLYVVAAGGVVVLAAGLRARAASS